MIIIRLIFGLLVTFFGLLAVITSPKNAGQKVIGGAVIACAGLAILLSLSGCAGIGEARFIAKCLANSPQCN